MGKEIYVSVTNLVTHVQVDGDIPIPIAVLYPTDYNMPLQALDAGPKFPKVAREALVKYCAADREGFFGDNAQCLIPKNMLCNLKELLSFRYEKLHTSIIDLVPDTVLLPKLTRPHWGNIPPPLDKYEFDNLIMFDFLGFAQQLPSTEDDLELGHANVKLFIAWSMWTGDMRVFKKLKACPAIFFLDEEAIRSTQGGRCSGRFGKHALSRNIGVADYSTNTFIG